jgi:hypothetical protein
MYYPLSQIITNLHTNGNEYVIDSTKENYVGYYWKASDGKIFTGKTPQDIPTQILISLPNINNIFELPKNYIQISSEINSEEYLIVKNLKSQLTEVPSYSLTLPTQQDYQLGEMRRYFCKKSNEILYLEINIDTYNKLVSKDSTIAYQYYIPFNLPWQITGTKEQVFTVNRNIVELTMKQQKLPMFDMYLKKDYTKYTA